MENERKLHCSRVRMWCSSQDCGSLIENVFWSATEFWVKQQVPFVADTSCFDAGTHQFFSSSSVSICVGLSVSLTVDHQTGISHRPLHLKLHHSTVLSVTLEVMAPFLSVFTPTLGSSLATEKDLESPQRLLHKGRIRSLGFLFVNSHKYVIRKK